MNILLISATSAEIAPLKEYITHHWKADNDDVYSNNDIRLHFVATGVGMLSTCYQLLKNIQNQPFDFILQAGIGGSYDRNIELGKVLFVKDEIIGDLGAEDHYNFLDVFDLGFVKDDEIPFQQKKLINPLQSIAQKINLEKVSGLTVNTSTGNSFTATSRQEKYGCVVESMEGAALHFVCLNEKIPFAQIRSISNYVEARDRSKWKIKEAITNLNNWLIEFLNEL